MASSWASRSYTNAFRSSSSPKGTILNVDELRCCELFRGSVHGAGGTSRDDVLKERKHEHSRRRAIISRVYKIGEQNFPLFLRAFRYPRSPYRPPITRM
ncbi:hypothetical protein TNCV_2944021 [Trichonephila clavipes]|nr:hypothetical protein TNCV_2944021 [Trichonephila clavipes]